MRGNGKFEAMPVLMMRAYLLLLHELGIGAVIDDISTENRSGQDGVDFFGIDILKLAI